MISHSKMQSTVGWIVTALLFLIWLLMQMHGCDLKSLWVEIPMLLCFIIVLPAWFRHASSTGYFVLRSVASVIAAIIVMMTYLSWLHSDYFPKWLLFPKSRIHERVAAINNTQLDTLLSSAQIDKVEFLWAGDVTNSVTGTEVQRLLASLIGTNRISSPDLSKDRVQRVYLINGTNEVLRLSLTEGGVWKFGSYSFRLQSPVIFPKPWEQSNGAINPKIK